MNILPIRSTNTFGTTWEAVQRAGEYYRREEEKLAEKIARERAIAGIKEVPEASEKTVFCDKFTKQIKLELLDERIKEYENIGNQNMADTLSIIRSLIAPADYSEKVPSLRFPRRY